jgi:hypothetical protein
VHVAPALLLLRYYTLISFSIIHSQMFDYHEKEHTGGSIERSVDNSFEARVTGAPSWIGESLCVGLTPLS